MAFGMDDSMEMGLETNVSDQASVQAGLDSSGALCKALNKVILQLE